MDSIKVKIPQHKLLIENPAFFNEIKSSQFSNSPNHKHEKTNNAFRREFTDKGIYTPKFHLLDVDFGVPDKSLVLEFSAAKLLHGTNLKEVSEANLPAIIAKLKAFLKTLGIGMFERDLYGASVILIAYSRNIPVAHLGRVEQILRVIAPFNYRPRSQFNSVILRQGIHTTELKYFNLNSHLTLYDKLTEIQHNPVTKEEKAIADYLRTGKNKPEFESWVKETLRVELTLHNKVAVKQVMAKYYDKKNNYTLAEVFKDNIRDELLKTEIDNIFNHPLKEIILLSVYEKEVFQSVLKKFCKTFTQKSEIRTMLDILYSRGLKALREEMMEGGSERTWFRKQKKLKAVAAQIQLPKGIGQLDNATVLEFILSQFGIKSELRTPKQQILFK